MGSGRGWSRFFRWMVDGDRPDRCAIDALDRCVAESTPASPRNRHRQWSNIWTSVVLEDRRFGAGRSANT